MDIDISGLLVKIGVDDHDKRILGEAESVLRLSKTKCPHLGPKEESLRSYLATDLALGKLGIKLPSGDSSGDISRDSLIKAANAKEKVYKNARERLRNVLGSLVLPKGKTIEQLAIKYAGGSVERSKILLQQYQEACRSTVTAEKSGRLEYNTPLYYGAVFCVASVEVKAKINRKSVANEVQVQAPELERICADIVKKCGLSSVEHMSRAFRINTPGLLEDKTEGGGIKGKGKRALPREGGQDAEKTGDGSDVSPSTTTRLGVPGSASPSSPRDTKTMRSGGGGGLPAARLFVDSGSSGSTNVPPRTYIPPVDPAASLKAFVKRLRTLESPLYSAWREETLQES